MKFITMQETETELFLRIELTFQNERMWHHTTILLLPPWCCVLSLVFTK